MRLLHTTTLEVIPFTESGDSSVITSEINDFSTFAIPKYAILSHTWGSGEVTLQELQGDPKVAEAKAGYKKIKASCELAKREGFDYIWIDTCCIDKTNSTELFEAINSMFRWYKSSSICYVYLADANEYNAPAIEKGTPIAPCRWYQRGWTLQELIAPSNISFFNADWEFVGTKKEHLELLSRATGIDPYSLNGGDLSRISAARRMSWLASRKTTRLEDMAYCMLGIFDINMPLLYGEGERAFVRLQEEILKKSNDQSLFAWKEYDFVDFYREDYGENYPIYGLLSSSPANFENSRAVSRFHDPHKAKSEIIYTKEGIVSNFLMCQDWSYQSGNVYVAVLECQTGHVPGVFMGIRLKKISAVSNQFSRIDTPRTFKFCRLNTNGEIDIGGFDLTEEQQELFDLEQGKPFYGIYHLAFNTHMVYEKKRTGV